MRRFPRPLIIDALCLSNERFSLSLSPNDDDDDDDDEPRERRRTTTLFDEKETALREERHVVVEVGCDL